METRSRIPSEFVVKARVFARRRGICARTDARKQMQAPERKDVRGDVRV